MPLQKQAINLNFAKGLDTKTDPWQVQFGSFSALDNIVFDIGGLLKKRNGFGSLSPLSDNSNSYLTTFNGDLTAIGTSINAYSFNTSTWVNKGTLQPMQLDVLSLIKNNTNQSWADIANMNGLVCTAYTDQDPSNLSANLHRFAVADQATGQNLVQPTTIANADPTYGYPRVFTLGKYFIIIYVRHVGGAYHLEYIAINVLNFSISTPAVIALDYAQGATIAFDAVLVNNSLYITWNSTAIGIKACYINQFLTQSSIITVSAHPGTIVSICDDFNTSVIWITFYDSSSNDGYTVAIDTLLNILLVDTQWTSALVINNIATAAQNSKNDIYYEVDNSYSYVAIKTNFIKYTSVTLLGVVSTPITLVRSVGLASKAFIIDGIEYFLATYQSKNTTTTGPYQPTYFLMNQHGGVVAKLAYQNGFGFLTLGVPNANVIDNSVFIPYLFKDLIEAVNKDTNVSSGVQTAGIYSQFGINMVSFIFTTDNIVTSEIGTNLNVTGGILWSYDGYLPVEQEFNVYPETVLVTTATGSGSIAADIYFYQVTYEWTDNQGNAFRSAPSIPFKITTTTASSTNTIKVPTLRLTYKIANPVKIVIYRWATAQPIYYQVTSITSPILNDPTIDSISFADTLSNASILGNNILYTTGGVLENIAPPACIDTFLFDNRLWLIDAEDRNLLWFSKQVIESTPVEMSDLLTLYIAPTTGAQGSTGPLTCGAPMDDKAILFKKDAILYINGSGPDNTGNNNQYSQPIFVTGTVGCSNPNSIVIIPNGMMFQSDKGIWLLGRDLSTQYIGAPVEQYNDSIVTGAKNIPAQNRVVFTLNNGMALMYDYYYNQWGTFSNINAVSSTLFQSLLTYIDEFGNAFQETPGLYLDGSNPVTMSFITSWLNFAGVQGYQRSFFFYLIGKYLSPHKLNVEIAYDYNPSPEQSDLIIPDNFSNNYGVDSPYGEGSPYGGPGYLEQWRVFLSRQRCQSFQITLNEIYDPSFGVPAGAGLTLSGINLVVALKKGFKPINASNSVGASP